jgi:flagellar assembly factor FliW
MAETADRNGTELTMPSTLISSDTAGANDVGSNAGDSNAGGSNAGDSNAGDSNETSAAAEELTDIPALEFVVPLPGFPGMSQFALVALDDTATVYTLRSLEDPTLRFFVVPPMSFFPDYAPELDDQTATMLGLTEADQAIVLLVVNPGDKPGGATVNLLAPIVVNLGSRQAAQVVLSGMDLPVRAPLTAAA